MADWDDPLQRAAVWYVGAYGALGTVLLAGLSLAGFHWSTATHPLAAVACVVAAVGAALWVVTAATGVLTPRYSIGDLVKLQRAAEAKVPGSGWPAVAEEDGVLKALVTQDGLAAADYSPRDSLTAAEDPSATADARQAAAARCDRLVRAANRRAAGERFGTLRFVAPCATALILAAVLSWTSVSAPADDEATPTHPLAVSLHRAPGQDWPGELATGCHETELEGVALVGRLDREPLVATDPAADCPATVLRMTSALGWVTAR